MMPSECTPLTRHKMPFHRQSDDLLPVVGMCTQYLNGVVNRFLILKITKAATACCVNVPGIIWGILSAKSS